LLNCVLLLLDSQIAQAPGEAEAELAILNWTGIIDAVVTNDSDVFVFGATHVVRKYVTMWFYRSVDQWFELDPPSHSPYLTEGKDEMDVYTAVAIVMAPVVSLSLGGILLVALLSGGDYDPVSCHFLLHFHT
jgi:Holliday junction resolvase YEN1